MNSPLLGAGSCLYDEYGDMLLHNTYKNDGFFGNSTNGDFDQLNLQSSERTDCYRGNTDVSGKLSPDARKLQANYPCTGKKVVANTNFGLLNEVLCDTQVSLDGGSPPCSSVDRYPRQTHVVMHPLPKTLTSMPNPCQGVPSNPWCRKQ
jgi:hypothetical protein